MLLGINPATVEKVGTKEGHGLMEMENWVLRAWKWSKMRKKHAAREYYTILSRNRRFDSSLFLELNPHISPL